MRSLAIFAMGIVLWHATAMAGDSDSTESRTGVIGATGNPMVPEFTPLTNSERLRRYLESTFGPGAIAKSIAAGGFAQAHGTPREWGGGATAYGERVGNSFAIHVIRTTLHHGAAAALHEDNRYVHSTDTGFWKRSRHAVTSVFVARNEAGREHFAYSRFGSALGAAFISRTWQPRSTTNSGDAAVTFGTTIATDMASNMIREFGPKRFKRH